MPNQAIEIHDSELGSLVVSAETVILKFEPAYIHQSHGNPGVDAGTGWTQHLVIRVLKGTVNGSFSEMPCTLWEGDLVLNGTQLENTVPIPLDFEGAVELSLTSRSGESIQIRGHHIVLELIGEPRYVEDFSGV